MHIHALSGAYFLFIGLPWLFLSHVSAFTSGNAAGVAATNAAMAEYPDEIAVAGLNAAHALADQLDYSSPFLVLLLASGAVNALSAVPMARFSSNDVMDLSDLKVCKGEREREGAIIVGRSQREGDRSSWLDHRERARDDRGAISESREGGPQREDNWQRGDNWQLYDSRPRECGPWRAAGWRPGSVLKRRRFSSLIAATVGRRARRLVSASRRATISHTQTQAPISHASRVFVVCVGDGGGGATAAIVGGDGAGVPRFPSSRRTVSRSAAPASRSCAAGRPGGSRGASRPSGNVEPPRLSRVLARDSRSTRVRVSR